VVTEWNQILREKWYRQEEPDELVVSFVTLLKNRNKKARVLDLGCGAGRNLIYTANQRFEAHGVEISETGINFTKERLKKRNLKAHVVKGDMNLLPYINSCFGAVICLFTIYHQKLKGIQTTISEVHRVLRKGGILLANFQSKRSHMYGKGVKAEKDTFIRQNGPEKGVAHHFTDEEEIMKLLKGFKDVSIELRERKSADGYLQSRLIVIANV
jgi:ubiquinone/menaquinone biosynthesis C-methylase UbiE